MKKQTRWKGVISARRFHKQARPYTCRGMVLMPRIRRSNRGLARNLMLFTAVTVVLTQAIVQANADSTTFLVPPGNYYAITTRPMNEGDRMEYTFTISGGTGNDIAFSVKDAQGNLVVNAERVSRQYSGQFTASHSGSYYLYFDNSFSLSHHPNPST